MISPLAFLTFFNWLKTVFRCKTIGLVTFWCLPEEVPETRLGNNFVRCEDAHTVELGGRVGLRRQMAAHDLVFLEAHLEEEYDVSVWMQNTQQQMGLGTFGVDYFQKLLDGTLEAKG